MTRAEVLVILNELALDLGDADSLTIFFDETLRLLALSEEPPWCKAEIKALSSGTNTYAFEDDMLQIIEMIMHDELLSYASEKSLDAYSEDWQADTGTPTDYTTDNVAPRYYRLYPEPDFSSDAIIPTHGQPWGEDWPDDSLALIYADYRESDILDIFALPISFISIAQEFSYPSDHTNLEYATVCKGIVSLLSMLVGVRDASGIFPNTA